MAAGTLTGMAEAESTAPGRVAPGTAGAIQCRAPGCENWFVKNSGRHIYCKLPDCTYRRGAPPEAELEQPEGAAAELMRRLQEQEEAEVGPAQLNARLRAVQEGLRAGDNDATYGALIDVGTCSVWFADRVRRGELPPQPLAAVSPQRQGGQRPVGLVHAVVASHHRTYALGDRRVQLVYELMTAREELSSTLLALEQTQGTPAEEEARNANRAAKTQLDSVERALQSVEAAWAERGQTLQELEGAAAVSAPPSKSNGERRG